MHEVYEEAGFLKEIFTNGLNIGLSLQVRVENIVHCVEKWWLFGKEKVQYAVINKEGHADNLLGHEKTHDLISLKKMLQ